MRLNQRPLWTEEDGYEREMRLATASFLAATTLAVGQPAVALDFVVVDPAGTQTCIVIRRRRSFLLARASSSATRTEIGTGLYLPYLIFSQFCEILFSLSLSLSLRRVLRACRRVVPALKKKLSCPSR